MNSSDARLHTRRQIRLHSQLALSLLTCTVGKAVVKALAANIYVAGVQIEEGSFATSYIPTTNAVTRGKDFAIITGSNFSSCYNPRASTFGVEFQTLYAMNDIKRFILTGDGGSPLQLLTGSANTGNIASFDDQSYMFAGISVVGVLSKAYLAYTSIGRSLSARGSTSVIY